MYIFINIIIIIIIIHNVIQDHPDEAPLRVEGDLRQSGDAHTPSILTLLFRYVLSLYGPVFSL